RQTVFQSEIGSPRWIPESGSGALLLSAVTFVIAIFEASWIGQAFANARAAASAQSVPSDRHKTCLCLRAVRGAPGRNNRQGFLFSFLYGPTNFASSWLY